MFLFTATKIIFSNQRKSNMVGKTENFMLLKENRQAKIEEEKISKLLIILTLFDTLIAIQPKINLFCV